MAGVFAAALLAVCMVLSDTCLCAGMPIYRECTREQAASTSCAQGERCMGHVVLGRRMETFCVDLRSYGIFLDANSMFTEATRTPVPVPTVARTPRTSAPASSRPHRDVGTQQQQQQQQQQRPPQDLNSLQQGTATLRQLQQRYAQNLQRMANEARKRSKSPGDASLQNIERPPSRPLHRSGGEVNLPLFLTVREACVACQQHDVTQQSFKQTVLTTDRICASDFAFRVRAVSSTGNRHSVRILAVYRLQRIPVLATPNITDIFLENTRHSNLNALSRPCVCNMIVPGREYLITGKDDITTKQFTVTEQDLVLEWSNRVGRRTLRLVPHCYSSK